MLRFRSLIPALVLAGAILPAQEPAPVPIPVPAATPAPPQVRQLKAQYKWGYADDHGTGKGSLNVLLEPASGRTILELFGLGERLVFLEGDRAQGYHVLIPRRQVDQRAATLGAVPLPFFPQVPSPEALYRLLAEGAGPGVKATRDAKGPVKLSYEGKDDQGGEVQVWLRRTRWELTQD